MINLKHSKHHWIRYLTINSLYRIKGKMMMVAGVWLFFVVIGLDSYYDKPEREFGGDEIFFVLWYLIAVVFPWGILTKSKVSKHSEILPLTWKDRAWFDTIDFTTQCSLLAMSMSLLILISFDSLYHALLSIMCCWIYLLVYAAILSLTECLTYHIVKAQNTNTKQRIVGILTVGSIVILQGLIGNHGIVFPGDLTLRSCFLVCVVLTVLTLCLMSALLLKSPAIPLCRQTPRSGRPRAVSRTSEANAAVRPQPVFLRRSPYARRMVRYYAIWAATAVFAWMNVSWIIPALTAPGMSVWGMVVWIPIAVFIPTVAILIEVKHLGLHCLDFFSHCRCVPMRYGQAAVRAFFMQLFLVLPFGAAAVWLSHMNGSPFVNDALLTFWYLAWVVALWTFFLLFAASSGNPANPSTQWRLELQGYYWQYRAFGESEIAQTVTFIGGILLIGLCGLMQLEGSSAARRFAGILIFVSFLTAYLLSWARWHRKEL